MHGDVGMTRMIKTIILITFGKCTFVFQWVFWLQNGLTSQDLTRRQSLLDDFLWNWISFIFDRFERNHAFSSITLLDRTFLKQHFIFDMRLLSRDHRTTKTRPNRNSAYHFPPASRTWTDFYSALAPLDKRVLNPSQIRIIILIYLSSIRNPRLSFKYLAPNAKKYNGNAHRLWD